MNKTMKLILAGIVVILVFSTIGALLLIGVYYGYVELGPRNLTNILMLLFVVILAILGVGFLLLKHKGIPFMINFLFKHLEKIFKKKISQSLILKKNNQSKKSPLS